jgi:hypothetical protein
MCQCWALGMAPLAHCLRPSWSEPALAAKEGAYFVKPRAYDPCQSNLKQIVTLFGSSFLGDLSLSFKGNE